MSTQSLELPVIAARPTASESQSVLEPAERDRLIRRAKALSWFSLAYMPAEGAIGITAAILASSVALLGFGLDSAIEGLASIIVIWRCKPASGATARSGSAVEPRPGCDGTKPGTSRRRA